MDLSSKEGCNISEALRVLAVFALGLWPVMQINAQGPTQVVRPRLSCEVVSGKLGEPTAGRVAKVSNLKRIPLRASLSDSELPLEQLTVTGFNEHPGPGPGATLAIAAKMILKEKKLDVPTKVIRQGMGRSLNEQSVSALLEIPIDESKRKKNIVAYVKKIESESARANDKQQLKVLEASENALVARFEQLYVENRVGLFEVTCRYISRGSKLWNGEVESRPVLIQVVFDGEFFDQPNFR